MTAADLDWAEAAAATRYTRVPDWLLDRRGMSPHAKTLYAVIGRHINRERGCAWPGLASLAEFVGCSERRLRDAVTELVDAGVLHVKRRPNRTSVYRLRFTDPLLDDVDQAARDAHTPPPGPAAPAEPRDPGPAESADPDRQILPPNQTEKNQTAERDAPAGGCAPVPIDPEAEAIYAAIAAIDPRPDVTATAAARAMLDEDGRDVRDVLELTEWIAADPFWRGRIRSVRNLRRFYDQVQDVRAHATRPSTPSSRPTRRGGRRATPRFEGHCCATAGSPPHAAEGDWRRVAGGLRDQLPTDEWDLWFADAHPHAGTDGELLIAVPAAVAAIVAQRYRRLITALAGRPVEIVHCHQEHT